MAQGGQLKIFFGYTLGEDTLRAMLKGAADARRTGEDVLLGALETEPGPGLKRLLRGLPVLGGASPRKPLDVDEALSRRPGLLVVENLAGRNPEGSRHARQYRAVRELLDAGISVYTTLDVRQIESLQDTIADILGPEPRDCVPDAVFDGAQQVAFVDREPQELLQRQEGTESLSLAQLTALREIALRRSADRLRRRTAGPEGEYRTGEHILVCLSSAPSNPRIVRTGAKMAAAFQGRLTALYVRTPGYAAMGQEDRERLQANTRLAESLGASVETTYGEDISTQIAEYARLAGVTKIVLGRSTVKRRHLWSKPPLTETLAQLAPNLDIYIIPDSAAQGAYQPPKPHKSPGWRCSPRELGLTLGLLAGITAISQGFYVWGFSEANIMAVYLLGILLIAVLTRGWLCSLTASAASVVLFGYLFTQPRFTLNLYDKRHLVTMLILFSSALLTGTLANRLKGLARESAMAAYRSKMLFETNQELQKAEDAAAVAALAGQQLSRLLGREVAVALKDGAGLEMPRRFGNLPGVFPDGWEDQVAGWVLRNHKRAGASTETFPDARNLYLAIRSREEIYGVVGIALGDAPLEPFEYSVVLSVLGECALALDSRHSVMEKAQTELRAQREQLRADLLRSISHDLRSPLTSISGNASNLLTNGEQLDTASRRQIYGDIYDDAVWLTNLVENLLSVTRLEDGRMTLHTAPELMDDILAEAVRHTGRRKGSRTIVLRDEGELLLVNCDGRLIVQVVCNLLDNAIKYTPEGAHIQVQAENRDGCVQVTVSDDGPGIPAAEKAQIFEMFCTGSGTIADSRRSLGLGLALCRSILTAHGGRIWVEDNQPSGARFVFTLPRGKVEIHE